MTRVIIAALLNLFTGSLGYFYLGYARRFLAFTFTSVFLLPVILYIFFYISPPSWYGKTHSLLMFFAVIGFQIFLVIDAVILARREPPNTPALLRKPLAYISIGAFLVFSLVFGFFRDKLKDVFMSTNDLPTNSMAPTFIQGDHIYSRRLNSKSTIPRGTIVAHRHQDKMYLKRIVGLPGEQIEIVEEILGSGNRAVSVGRIKVDGKLLPSQGDPANIQQKNPFTWLLYLPEEGPRGTYRIQETNSIVQSAFTPIFLGPNEYFLIGDNRDDSLDSRFIGPIERKDILFEYAYTYFSLDYRQAECEDTERQGTSNHDCKMLLDRNANLWDRFKVKARRASIRWDRIGRVEP